MYVVVIAVDLSYFTDGDSSLYDGTLVGQFVARVLIALQEVSSPT